MSMSHQITVIKPDAKAANLAIVILAALSLVSCGLGSMSDLEDYINQIKARKSTRIEPLPEIKPYETYIYASSELRDPFRSTFQIEEERQRTVASNTGISPDVNRRKEALEAFPLDTLRMVGILKQQEVTWAIIKANDGTVHRVHKGNYMGQNHGRIVKVHDAKIELTEIVPNGTGGWEERPASIALSE
jgi:type IV pilus assembly protein PilP